MIYHGWTRVESLVAHVSRFPGVLGPSVGPSVRSILPFFLVYVSRVRDRGTLSSVLIWFHPAFHNPHATPSAPSRAPLRYVYAYLCNTRLPSSLHFYNFHLSFPREKWKNFRNSAKLLAKRRIASWHTPFSRRTNSLSLSNDLHQSRRDIRRFLFPIYFEKHLATELRIVVKRNHRRRDSNFIEFTDWNAGHVRRRSFDRSEAV